MKHYKHYSVLCALFCLVTIPAEGVVLRCNPMPVTNPNGSVTTPNFSIKIEDPENRFSEILVKFKKSGFEEITIGKNPEEGLRDEEGRLKMLSGKGGYYADANTRWSLTRERVSADGKTLWSVTGFNTTYEANLNIQYECELKPS